jgi:hypothetical protein
MSCPPACAQQQWYEGGNAGKKWSMITKPNCSGETCMVFLNASYSPYNTNNPYSLTVPGYGANVTLGGGSLGFRMEGTANNNDGSITWMDPEMGPWLRNPAKSSEHWSQSTKGSISSRAMTWIGVSVIALVIILVILYLSRKRHMYYF